uniref:Amino acid permease/ SLC12A domain-containing protein n=1 Tax=Chromera velia CCMP2878 TaxID=1169474 RepID=A0A0G4I7M2_9ALVE|mmetsp:Transcript_18393/g.37222  ORF Transcript_18393/g.37222 Transcript_18393/m.37222 type:complete len:698 (+) Transcript_18393:45-2138(+)|eukprot:Cvel_11682.t1-p1 / transcript=Cvel_11682.t1 / gene=Cvel_11682 / organism=Chromera_velia_CCMP2878 / gene_product=Probable polyamine transporter At1g31820, putative / transcript_product=Probable polyamine transporter At1g31820, putative / location=Cvel_scaffold740:61384-65990(+) / protein_length=697 / sequence_SO=supercontig / SO=protein_coding / is_pseudo=false
MKGTTTIGRAYEPAQERTPSIVSEGFGGGDLEDLSFGQDGYGHSAGSLGLWGLVGLAFFNVCGGAYGSEVLLKAVGLPVGLMGQLLISIVYAIPYSLVCLEQALLVKKNGAQMVWAKVAFGRTAGFFAGCVYLLYEFLVLGSYASFSVDYCGFLMPPRVRDSMITKVLLATLISLTALFLCRLDMGRVGHAFSLLMVAVFAPFVLFTVVALVVAARTESAKEEGEGEGGSLKFLPQNPDWWQGVTVLLYMNSGYGSAFVRVRDATDLSLVPKATAINVGLTTLTYMMPLWAGAMVEPDYSKWVDGFFVKLSRSLPVGGLGTLIAVMLAGGSLAAALGMLVADLAVAAEFAACMAEHRYLPSVLRLHERNIAGQPWRALLAMFIPACLLSAALGFKFERLAGLSAVFYSIGVLFKFSSFLRFRQLVPVSNADGQSHTSPRRTPFTRVAHLRRLYEVPLRSSVACVLFCLPAMAISFLPMALVNDWTSAAWASLPVALFLLVLYVITKREATAAAADTHRSSAHANADARIWTYELHSEMWGGDDGSPAGSAYQGDTIRYPEKQKSSQSLEGGEHQQSPEDEGGGEHGIAARTLSASDHESLQSHTPDALGRRSRHSPSQTLDAAVHSQPVPSVYWDEISLSPMSLSMNQKNTANYGYGIPSEGNEGAIGRSNMMKAGFGAAGFGANRSRASSMASLPS